MAHKGALTTKIIEPDFPHGVVMPVPENGFGSQLYVFEDWHHNAGIVSRNGHRIRGDREKISWVFADAAMADKFQMAVSATIFHRRDGSGKMTVSKILEIGDPAETGHRPASGRIPAQRKSWNP